MTKAQLLQTAPFLFSRSFPTLSFSSPHKNNLGAGTCKQKDHNPAPRALETYMPPRSAEHPEAKGILWQSCPDEGTGTRKVCMNAEKPGKLGFFWGRKKKKTIQRVHVRGTDSKMRSFKMLFLVLSKPRKMWLAWRRGRDSKSGHIVLKLFS